MRIESSDTQTQPSLREIRLSRNLGLRETARRSGIDPAQLSRVERGHGGLSVEATIRLAKVLGMRGLPQRLSLFTEAK